MLDKSFGEPFTRAMAAAAGITDRQLSGPRFQRIFRGVYVHTGVPVTDLVLARAALLLHPGTETARVSHHTAARLTGLPVPPSAEVHVSVSVVNDRRRRPGIRSHCNPGASAAHRGVPLSTPVQLFQELSGALSLVDLVVLGDALVAREHLNPDRFRQLVDCTSGVGSAAARAAALVREGVDSAMETRLRLLLVLGGLPEPVVNHTLRTDDGHRFLRFDLAYPGLRLAIEYDGRQHAQDTTQWRHDIARREWLDANDWRLVIVTAEGVYQDPQGTLARVTDALRGRGLAVRQPSARWQRHFPGRQRSPRR